MCRTWARTGRGLLTSYLTVAARAGGMLRRPWPPTPKLCGEPWREGADLLETLKQARLGCQAVGLGADLRFLKGKALESRTDYSGMK